MDQRHPALASPPHVSALTPPGPRQRRLRRQAICRLSCSGPSLLLRPRVAHIGAHRLPPPARARRPVRRDTASFRCPSPGRRRPPPGGRLLQAQLRREIGRKRARSPRDCADCGAPGGGWCAAESRPAVEPQALPDHADCKQY